MSLYTQNCTQSNTAAGNGAVDALLHFFRQWSETRRLKAGIANERRQLAGLTTDQLRDIGVSHADAELESQRTDLPPFRTSL